MTTTMPKPVYERTLLIGMAKRYPNSARANCPVEVCIELRPDQKQNDGLELSICGNVWLPGRSDIIAGGQLREGIREYLDVSSISEEKLSRIIEIWDRWHLNGLRAGCEHQRAAGEHSAWVGVYPEKGYPAPRCLVCGYSYGSAWLHEELPQEIIEEVKSW